MKQGVYCLIFALVNVLEETFLITINFKVYEFCFLQFNLFFLCVNVCLSNEPNHLLLGKFLNAYLDSFCTILTKYEVTDMIAT